MQIRSQTFVKKLLNETLKLQVAKDFWSCTFKLRVTKALRGY